MPKIVSLIILLSLILLFSISCKSNEDPKTEEKTFASYAGTWWGDFGKGVEEALITINTDGSFTILNANTQVPSSAITKSSDTSYTVSYEGATMIFNFSSDTQATVDFGGGSQPIPITRK